MILYQLTDLGEAPSAMFDQSKAGAIDGAGRCIGNWYAFDGTAHSRGFIGSSQQAPVGIGIFPQLQQMSRADDISEAGLVVGGHWQFQSPQTKHTGVFLYSAASTITEDLTPAIAQSIAFEQVFPRAINSNGVILGTVHESNPVKVTKFTLDTKSAAFSVFSTPPGQLPSDINANNIIALGGTSAAYFDGRMHEINGSAHGSANAINDLNYIVGSTKGGAFLFHVDSSSLKMLDTLEGPTGVPQPNSSALGVNAHRDVVGWSDFELTRTAFLYRDSTDGPMLNLNDLLLDQLSGWHLTEATDINDDGSIVGYGRINYGKDRAFLLTPVEVPDPPPTFDDLAVDPLAMILANEVYVKLKLPYPVPQLLRARVREAVRSLSAREKRAALDNVKTFETYAKVLGEELRRSMPK